MVQESVLTQIHAFAVNLKGELARIESSESYDSQWVACIRKAEIENPWFTKREQLRSLKSWVAILTDPSFEAELNRFPPKTTTKTVGVIAAGNIPMVGLHDAISVLLSGHNLLLKCSSEDKILLPFFLAQLSEFVVDFKARYSIVEGFKSRDINALIATGSDNTARYFEYYFRENHKIIRKNRTSVAVLDGSETQEEMEALLEDVFAYFGLGCRSITKLYLPKGFDVQRVFKAMPKFEYLANHNKYMNNYTYHKALYLMNQTPYLENGFCNLVEEESLHSPVSCLHYEFYDDIAVLNNTLTDMQEKIQCRVGVDGLALGSAQKPCFTDYADQVNTMEFLNGL
ncbi:acyl-CoA reductase [Luteibaculum oceani]|nr:acyl-CoA reductase [Luteibaculum oceani]